MFGYISHVSNVVSIVGQEDVRGLDHMFRAESRDAIALIIITAP